MTTQVCRRIGLAVPSSVSSSSDPAIVQLMALANEEGQDLSARYPWQALINESSFTTVAVEAQGAMTTLAGTDFRYILNDVMWDRTLKRPIVGPSNPQDWQMMKAQAVTGPFIQFRIRGGSLKFIPVPTAGDSVYFEWISKNWVTVALGGTSSTWTADADTGLLDEEIMAQGVMWRWKASKGVEYAEDFNKYERLVADQMARDGGKSTLNLGGGSDGYPPVIMVPTGSW